MLLSVFHYKGFGTNYYNVIFFLASLSFWLQSSKFPGKLKCSKARLKVERQLTNSLMKIIEAKSHHLSFTSQYRCCFLDVTDSTLHLSGSCLAKSKGRLRSQMLYFCICRQQRCFINMKVIELFYSLFITASSSISRMFFSELQELQCLNVLNVRFQSGCTLAHSDGC